MAALATYFRQKRYTVTGSDTSELFLTDPVLKKMRIPVRIGFIPGNINSVYEYVIVTGAHGGMTNPEAQEAKRKHFNTMMHGRMLGEVMNGKKGISVAGCHGKTTTSAFIASLLTQAELDPSYCVGTPWINDIGLPGHFGRGDYFVSEADEYVTCPKTDKTPRFLWQKPELLVITNIEYDHPDVYPDLEHVEKAFLRFTENVKSNGLLIVCGDNKSIRKILPDINGKVVTYGYSPGVDYRILKVRYGNGISYMDIEDKHKKTDTIAFQLAGNHNALNVLAGLIAVSETGRDWNQLKKFAFHFTGTKRRFEKIAEIGSVLMYDDYAHHPTEINSTIQAARAWYPDKRLIILFQPHTYSRTKTLLSEFSQALNNADKAILADIFPSAREIPDTSFTSEAIVKYFNRRQHTMIYTGTKQKTLDYLQQIIQPKDLIITMGAGDIYTWNIDLINLLKKRYAK